MGKASSSKKIARAARAGGRVSSGQPRSLLFPGVLTLVVVLGLALVVYARNDRLQDDLGGVPQLGDHIHVAFAINVCGEFKEDIPEFESPVGIHTHGDGVLHVHPFSQLGVGANATLGRFFQDARDDGGLDLKVTDTKLSFGDEPAEEGKTKCEGVTDPILRLAWWDNVQDPASVPDVTTGDFNSRRLTTNGGGITLYYGAADADIPKPPTSANLAELGALDGGDVATTTTAGDGATTTTGVDESTTTTAGGDTTTTTAAP